MKVTFQKASGKLDELELPRDEDQVVQVLLEMNDDNDWSDVVQCVRAGRYWSILWGLSQFLRAKRKWANLTEDQYTLLEEIEDEFYSQVGNILEEVS